MAEKDITGMQSRDFLGDLTKNVTKSTGVGLYEKLAANARQQATEPLRKIANMQAFLQPINALITKAETAQKAGLAAYIAANPDIDESKLYDGTGDLVNNIMQENNRRFRELNKRLSFMNINNPEYQTLVNEINNINKTSAQLRADNEKLLNIRNMMRDDNKVELLSNGMSSSQLKMYEDIQVGNKENFVNINGNLHWQDPNNPDAEPIAISSIDAGGPTYQNSLVMEKTTELYSNVIDAAVIDDRLLYSKINNLWKMEGIGNSGLKSFIFDNQDASDIAGFATSDWFESWYRDQGITDEAEKVKEYDRIRNEGVLADGNKGNVKQHFSAWYHSKLKEVAGTQYNKQQQLKKSNLNLNAFEDEDESNKVQNKDTQELIKEIAGDKNEAGLYISQTGKGINFGDSLSPFAGITQYGWSGPDLPENSHLLEFGDERKVLAALTAAYRDYGFEFKDIGKIEDILQVTYTPPGGGRPIVKTFEFDNYGGGDPGGDGDLDHRAALELQQWMHNAVGYNSDYVYNEDSIKLALQGR